VEDIFLFLAVLFAMGMIILMVRYAKFIHNQPKLEEERRQDANKDSPSPDQ